MNYRIIITREVKGRCWKWEQGRKIVFGGYCRTKADAINDATITLKANQI